MEQIVRILNRSLKSIGDSLFFFVTYDKYVKNHSELENKVDRIEREEIGIKRELNWVKIGVMVSILIGMMALVFMICHLI